MTSSECLPKAEDVRLACAFIPDVKRREGVMALFALLETLREIPERVSESLMGEIRLRWWYEGFEAIREGRTPSYHPLMEHLQGLIHTYDLDVQTCLDMVEGQMPLLDRQPLTVKAALGLAETGEGNVLKMAVRVLGQDTDMTAVARLIGMATLKSMRGIDDASDAELAHLIRDARASVKNLPAVAMPLALPAVLATGLWQAQPSGPLIKRLKLTMAYITGRL